VAGFFSDRYGRKIIMVPALILFGLGGVLAGISAFIFSNPYYYILAGRIIQGIGGGGTYQLAMALAGDIFQTAERSKALGMLEASNGLGKVVAPLLGAGTALIIWYAPFFVYGILAFTAALLVWFLCQEPQHVGSNQSLQKYKRSLVEIFTAKGQGLAICFLAGMLTLFIFLAF
jgi:ACDE family multidrug resistance protein